MAGNRCAGYIHDVNFFGIRPASWINVASALSLVLLVILIVASKPGLLATGANAYQHYASSIQDISLSSVWTVAQHSLLGLSCWENLSFGTEEVAGGEKAIKTIFALGFVLVTAIYAALAIVANRCGVGGHQHPRRIRTSDPAGWKVRSLSSPTRLLFLWCLPT